MNILNFIKDNYLPISFTITLLAGIFKFWQYVDIRKNEQKQRNFENYHKLVERLTAPLSNHDDTYIDIQKAAVFEMRNYKEYKDVTSAIFEEWIKRNSRLSSLMEETLKYLGLK